MILSGRQVPGTAALMHLTRYCLPHAAPLSHILSPAAAKMLLDGKCDGEFPKQAVAAPQSTHKKMLGIRREKLSNFSYGSHMFVHVAVLGTYVDMGVCSGHRCQHRHVRDGRVLLGAIRVEMARASRVLACCKLTMLRKTTALCGESSAHIYTYLQSV